MKTITLSGLVSVFALCGCSASSSTSDESASDSLGASDKQTLRLLSEQISFSDGAFATTSYQYDEIGNLIGSISDNIILTYNIDTDGRIINIVGSVDGIATQSTKIVHYDVIGGLRRIDNVGSIEGVGIIGVSLFDLYKFEGDLATSLEVRRIPFEEIDINDQIEDVAGSIVSRVEFEYAGEHLIRELIDENGNGIVDKQRDYSYNSDGTLSSALEAGTSANSYVYLYEQGACNDNWGNSTHRYFCVAMDGL